MMRMRTVEIGVGAFVLAGAIAFVVLMVQVSGVNFEADSGAYKLYARFIDVAGLRVRSKVSMAGVTIGRVTSIRVDTTYGEAEVEIQINGDTGPLPIDTGARIVHACGFDSIPADMSVYELFRRIRHDGTGELGDTNFVLRGFAGGVSGGTIASMIEVFRAASGDPDTRRLLEDPYTLAQDRMAEPELGAQPDLALRRGREIAPELGGLWAAGFVMAKYNTRIVRRSNALLDYGYGRRFRYAEYMGMGPGPLAPVTAALTTAATAGSWALGSRVFRFLPRRLVERVAPKPGTGPSQDVRERGFYRAETYTTTTTGARYVATISQHGDPGYQATSVMLGESGLALALDRDALPPIYGVLTPAAAMGDALLARFPEAGISLDSARLD